MGMILLLESGSPKAKPNRSLFDPPIIPKSFCRSKGTFSCEQGRGYKMCRVFNVQASPTNAGWDGVSWPSNFSAVHVAAKLGDVALLH